MGTHTIHHPTTTMLHPSETQPQQPEAELPHDALYLVLAYLPVLDLLSASQVCTSFREAIRNDVLLWLDIYVDKPLSTRLSDDMLLLRIASRANGRIRSLALIHCARVTDQALQRLIHSNPLIQKLYLPGCSGLTPDGIVSAVKTCKHKLAALKINNIHNITKAHLQSLANYFPKPNPKPSYFHKRSIISLHDDPIAPIDVDICPKCGEVRMVFDCPKECCSEKCRGCRYCVMRCEECGECVHENDDPSETACGDTLCLKCWLLFPKCDLCNKPYCKEHAATHQACSSSRFICSACLSQQLDLACKMED